MRCQRNCVRPSSSKATRAAAQWSTGAAGYVTPGTAAIVAAAANLGLGEYAGLVGGVRRRCTPRPSRAASARRGEGPEQLEVCRPLPPDDGAVQRAADLSHVLIEEGR